MIAALLCALAIAPHTPATLDGWLSCRGAPQEGEWIVHGEWQFDAAGWNAKLDEFSQLELPHDVAEFELELAWLPADGSEAKRQRLAVRDDRAEVGDFVERELRESLKDKLEYLAGPVLLRRVAPTAPWRVYVLGGGRRYTELRRRERATMPGTEVALFDRLTLTGWKALGDARYTADMGAIVGAVDGGAQSFLITEREFGDFVLDVDVRNELPGNSGIQVRSQVDASGRLFGYQLEIDPTERAWSGGLYDEGRRGWLDDLADDEHARKAFVVGDWNHYRIECHGPWLRAWVNGVPTANWLDPLDPSGVLGLQVHSGKDTRVRWSNLRLRDLGTRRWVALDFAALVGRLEGAGGEKRAAWGQASGDFGLRFPWRGADGRARLYFRVVGEELETPGPLLQLGPALWRTTSGYFLDLAAPELRAEHEQTLTLLAFGERVALFVDARSLVQAALEPTPLAGRFAFESDGAAPASPLGAFVLN
ncbi:MAG: DUF1080 domain-containing protein [Planctomycetes bacterium]|nr:DUF1080 domain-containing protein [Planctomycetota bacterium]